MFLPMLLSEAGTIKVNSKRKLQFKSSALSLNIRPYKAVQAANWLMSDSHLYKDVFNSKWANQYDKETKQHQNVNVDVDACNGLLSNNSEYENIND